MDKPAVGFCPRSAGQEAETELFELLSAQNRR